MIIDSDDIDVNVLNGSVVFVGDTSSEIYKKLSAAGKVTKAHSLEEVQG
jgi:hypothetical protein